MEIFRSVVLGELTARSINFIIDKCFKPQAQALRVADSLQRALLRSQIVVDEAMGRHITNQAMLRQLDMLRDAMHRGCYALDTFRSTQDLGQLREALDRLSSTIADVDVLVMFLTSCPRLYRQPYSMHILLDNCMFGRQTEGRRIINFLLESDAQPHGSEVLEVLPVVGPGKIGKTTLVTHVCKDGRVLDHFSGILFLHDHDFTDEEIATFAAGRRANAMKHQNRVSSSSPSSKSGRLLLVVELSGDLSEDEWSRLYSASKRCMPAGSKIILTSQSNKITKFGTTGAVALKQLSDEEYWYFFKTLAFGSTDPETHHHPRFLRLAMEIARTQNGSFTSANITARFLRDNLDDAGLWCKVLAFLRGSFQKHVSELGEHPFDLMKRNRAARFGRMAKPCQEYVVHRQYQRSSEEEVPDVTIEDLIYGSAMGHGRFEVLAWRSRVPPYYSYVYTCEIREVKNSRAAKRKRSVEDGGTVS